MRGPVIPLSSLQLRKLIRRSFSTLPNSLSTSQPPPPALPLHRPEFVSSYSFARAQFLCFPIRAELLSTELQKDPDAEPLPLPKRLDLSFSHIAISPTLLLATLNVSPDAGRAGLDFFKWVKSRPGFQPSDDVYSYFVDYFGRRKDFKATHEILMDGRGVAGIKSLEALVDRLVRAGRPTHAVALFERMESD
ncbi:hypothetical protein OROGR_004671 [Orobanche gracilis]